MVEQNTSSQRLRLSRAIGFSVMGLLPELLFDCEPKLPFCCGTPEGEEPVEVLIRTSPRGPPGEGPQEMSPQLLCFRDVDPIKLPVCPKSAWNGSNSWDSLRGEDAEEQMSDEATGIDTESCVQSDFRSSGHTIIGLSNWALGKLSMNWWRDCWWLLGSGSVKSRYEL